MEISIKVIAIFHHAIIDKIAMVKPINIDHESPNSNLGGSISNIKNILQIIAKTKAICAMSCCATSWESAKKNRIHQLTAHSHDTFHETQSNQFIELIINIIQIKIRLSAIKWKLYSQNHIENELISIFHQKGFRISFIQIQDAIIIIAQINWIHKRIYGLMLLLSSINEVITNIIDATKNQIKALFIGIMKNANQKNMIGIIIQAG